jgi:arylsulfatase
MPRAFQGDIQLDVRDSKPDWGAFLADRAPEGAPNVLVVLYDDTGLAAWSPFGGRIEMPTLQKLADNGLTYSQWHTTALCSPTRSTFLTGRNHHLNGYAQIAEGAQGYPAFSSHIPPENGTIAHVLRDAGWSTFWVGKNHNVPIDAWGMGASRKEWPLGLGYDRFYGFIHGETNNWYPDLVEDNHFVDQPYQPEEGYHLSKDLADKAIGFIRDTKQSEPDKPWYLWFCPGANHAPHHAPQEYIDKYKGKFDDGYEAYREWVLPRMVEKGILPAGTELTPINPMPEDTISEDDIIRPWDTLSDDEKRLFSRMAEVYAGFFEYTDAQVGRIIDYLEESGQLENTIVFYCADNGASGEGSPNGSVNENKFFNSYPDSIEDNLALLEHLGSPETYNHYPNGWAVGFSTPFRMFKRYSYQGGVCDPLVISWPKGIKARGEVRSQYHHSVDIVPTILEACGIEMPDKVNGVDQSPLSGISMAYTFKGDGATRKETQYYEMLGTRGIWHKGLEGRRRARPIPRPRQVRRGSLAAVPHRRGPLGSQRPGRRASRPSGGAQGALDGGGQAERRPAPERHDRPRTRDERRRLSRTGAAERTVCLLPGHVRGSRGAGGEHPRRLVQDPRRGRVRRHKCRGHRGPGLALRRVLPVRQGRDPDLRVQLPGHPAGAAPVGARAPVRAAHRRRRVHQGAHRRPLRAHGHDEAPHRRPGRRGRGVQDDRRVLRPVRRGPVRRL